jgi:hypothetical protein
LIHPDLIGIDYLFLVGGFAESPLLQQAVRTHFGEHVTVIIPQVQSKLNLFIIGAYSEPYFARM